MSSGARASDSNTGLVHCRVLKPVAENIWIVDDFFSIADKIRIPIRMTVIRLNGNGLILHSPIEYSPALREALEQLGSIRYLVAPSTAHWVHIPHWQRAVPNATTLAVPGLATRRPVRAAGLRIDRELLHETPREWAADIETVLLSAASYSEIAFFHKLSKTLVLTDLVQNIRPQTLQPGIRAAARAVGVTAPSGMAPVYLRLWLRLGGRAVRLAADRLIGFMPERVIFAHGDWFENEGTERLRNSLRWLTGASGSHAGQRELAGVRIVITGASSGIGRTAALTLAGRGASLTLAARRKDVLEKLAAECEALGGHAIAAPTDVTDPDAVAQLASKAEEAFSGIDVWINNAGTGVVGTYPETDMALHRRTIEVNLLGSMNGAHAVLPVFLKQGHGILINNISMGGWMPTPFAAAYTASKFGLRGFTASLRQELATKPNIHVCAVFPAMVDTPGFVHGANWSGRNLDPGPLLYQPEDVAQTFLSLVRRPRDEVAVGWPARLAQVAYAATPALAEKSAGATFRYLLSRASRADRSDGSMLEPNAAGTAGSGGWLARKSMPPAGTISTVAALAVTTALALTAISRLRNSKLTKT